MSTWDPKIPQVVSSELPPYGVKPHWITFRFSAQANRLYDLYNAHVNRERGDRIVWPTLDDLASMMGLSRGDKVTPYMRELEDGGAIGVRTVTRTGGEGRRYVVTVRVSPPEGYGGPLQSSDWHRAHRAAKSRKATMRDRARGVTGNKSAAQEVPPLEGVYVPPPEGGDVHPVEGVRSSNNLNHNKEKNNQADAVGQSAGGFPRARATSSAAGETGEDGGGSAASRTISPPRKTSTRSSTRSVTVKTRPRKHAAGYDDVRAAIPTAVSRPGTALYPGLTRAINDLLRGNPGAGIPARTPEQIVFRINRRWYGENAETRAAADYRGCGQCTPSGCESPRRSEEHPDGCDRIKNPSSWLATALLAQDCPDPQCEDGQLLDGRGECRVCVERAAERREAEAARVALAERLKEEMAELIACREADAEEQQEASGPFGFPLQVTTWRCEGAGCGRPGRGAVPLMRLCDECQEDMSLSLQEAHTPF